MYRIDTRIIATLIGALALALAGCGGGGGGGSPLSPAAELLPAADNTLPDEYSGDGPGEGRFGDYLNSGGTWRVNLDEQVQTTVRGTTDLLGALVYDYGADEWTANMDGTNRVFVNLSDNLYLNVVPDVGDIIFTIYDADDNPFTSQYGTFGRFRYNLGSEYSVIFAHAGLKTPLADMPGGGVGIYEGEFVGRILGDDYNDRLQGDATIVTDFSTGIYFDSFDSATGGDIFGLTGIATFTGNTYQGTLSGWYDDGDAVAFSIDPDSGSFSGAFYGPDQITVGVSETAGVIYGADTAGKNELVGGFWMSLDSYKP